MIGEGNLSSNAFFHFNPREFYARGATYVRTFVENFV